MEQRRLLEAGPLLDAALGHLGVSERHVVTSELLEAERILNALAVELSSLGPANWGASYMLVSATATAADVMAWLSGGENGTYLVDVVLTLERGDSAKSADGQPFRPAADAKPDVWFVECKVWADPPDWAPSDGPHLVHVIPETRHTSPADSARGVVAMARRLCDVMRSRPPTYEAWCRKR